ncbi:hypothetical protein LINPERPRIM_LOCUS20053 [Linum perenne]
MIAWMAALGLLVCRTDVAKWGLTIEITCLMYGNGVDDINHLFH